MQKKNSITQNAIILYIRTFISIGIGIYSVRIVLNNLKIEDYGIYSLVNGIVYMFSFIYSSLASGAQRYISYEIGSEDDIKRKIIFRNILFFYFIFAIIILVVAETIGLWFLNAKLNIDISRMLAANIVYQSAVLSMIISVLFAGYYALIIAHEEMTFFAYVTIIISIIKLFIAYLLHYINTDRLIFYSVSILLLNVIEQLIYYVIMKRKHGSIYSYSFLFEKQIFKSLFSYSSYNILGSSALVIRQQGINIILNLFFGALINAARGISQQIQHALNTIIGNIYLASRPQIVRLFASGNYLSMWAIVYDSISYSFFLYILIAVPIYIETQNILLLWLGDNIPEYTVQYVRLFIIGFAFEVLTNQLIAVLQSANKIKRFQIVTSIVLLLNIPISYIILSFGGSPIAPAVIYVLLNILYSIPLVYFAFKEVNLDINYYLFGIVLRLIIIALVPSISIIYVMDYLSYNSMNRLFITLPTITIILILLIWFIGLNKAQKINMKNELVKRVKITKTSN